jgi:hypothetical protein
MVIHCEFSFTFFYPYGFNIPIFFSSLIAGALTQLKCFSEDNYNPLSTKYVFRVLLFLVIILPGARSPRANWFRSRTSAAVRGVFGFIV